MSVKLEAVADDSKNVFTFEFSIKNVSAFTQGQILYSPEYIVNNLSWRLKVERNSNDDLAVYLHSNPCSANSNLWSCFATVRLTLVSFEKSLSEDFSREYKQPFVGKGWGYESFIDWSSVTDSEEGYMKNDAIKFQVHVEADTPNNVASNLKVAEPSSTGDWLRLFENSLNNKIVLRIADEFKKLDSTIEKVRTSVNDLKVSFKETVDPIVDSVRKEVTSLEKKLENINPDFKLLTTPVLDKLILLEAKIEESGSTYMAAVENLQHSISEETENQIRGISELENIKNTIEKGKTNEEEALEKIVGAAVEPIATGISAEIQALAQKLEKMDEQAFETKRELSSHLSAGMQAVEEKIEKTLLERGTAVKPVATGISTHIQMLPNELEKMDVQSLETKLEQLSSHFSAGMQAVGEKMELVKKVITELQNVNSSRNDATDDDLSNRKTIPESEPNSNGNKAIANEVGIVPEITVPLSTLKYIKELFVEQPQRMLCNHSLMCGSDLKGNVFQSYHPMMSQREFHLHDDPSFCENSSGSLTNSSLLKSEDLATGKRKRAVDTRNNYYDMLGPNETTMAKSPALSEQLGDSSKEELMFLGKTEDGEWKAHKVSDPKQLEELCKCKDYKSFRIYDLQE